MRTGAARTAGPPWAAGAAAKAGRHRVVPGLLIRREQRVERRVGSAVDGRKLSGQRANRSRRVAMVAVSFFFTAAASDCWLVWRFVWMVWPAV